MTDEKQFDFDLLTKPSREHDVDRMLFESMKPFALPVEALPELAKKGDFEPLTILHIARNTSIPYSGKITSAVEEKNANGSVFYMYASEHYMIERTNFYTEDYNKSWYLVKDTVEL